MAEQRTLWTEGRAPARLVGWCAALAAVALVGINLVTSGQLGLLFDLAFVAVCIGAALAIRPHEFFLVGVLPPLLMAGIVGTLAIVDRSAVADSGDVFLQALVSGLAHNVTALVIGYAATLLILGLRQQAYRHQGRLRATPTMPRQRTAPPAASGGDESTEQAPDVRIPAPRKDRRVG